MRAAALTFVALLLGTTPTPTPTNNPECMARFGNACSEALGAWLPQPAEALEAWRDGRSRSTARTDSFVYQGRAPERSRFYFGLGGGPQDGMAFVYGNAGPPKGRLVYDYGRGIAFYDQGCCAWHATVAAANVPPPPKRVRSRDLTSLHTLSGIALGDSIAKVRRIYGDAQPAPVPNHPGMQALWYHHMLSKSCGQFQGFAFERDRLVFIELEEAC